MSHTTIVQTCFFQLSEVELRCAVGKQCTREFSAHLYLTLEQQAVVKAAPVRRFHQLLSYLGASAASARNKNKNWSGQKHEQLGKTGCGNARTGLKKGELYSLFQCQGGCWRRFWLCSLGLQVRGYSLGDRLSSDLWQKFYCFRSHSTS